MEREGRQIVGPYCIQGNGFAQFLGIFWGWRPIIKYMARGWESKSVEEQQNEAAAITSAEQKDIITKKKAERARKLQGLTLMRARVKEQLERSQNPRYVEVLRSELEQIDKQIQELG